MKARWIASLAPTFLIVGACSSSTTADDQATPAAVETQTTIEKSTEVVPGPTTEKTIVTPGPTVTETAPAEKSETSTTVKMGPNPEATVTTK